MSCRRSSAGRVKKFRFLKKHIEELLETLDKSDEPVPKKRNVEHEVHEPAIILSTRRFDEGDTTDMFSHVQKVEMDDSFDEQDDEKVSIQSDTIENGSNDSLLMALETIPNQASNINNTDAMLAQILRNQEESEKRMMRKIESMKRSILYEIRLKAEEIKTAFTSATGSVCGRTLNEHQASLGVELPINTLDIFLRLEDSLTDARKIESMKVIMTSKTHGHSECSKAIAKILSSIISKAVQLLYSGCGRGTRVNGTFVNKRNFSRTHTYKCMEEVLIEKYQKSEKEILTMTSRWLAGAGDRERGRANRR